MNFHNQWFNEPVISHTFTEKTSIVEQAGVQSTRQRVEAMVLAGQNLVKYRKEQCDLPDFDDDDTPLDPTRDPNFDFLDDATPLLRSIRPKVKTPEETSKAEVDPATTTSVTESKTI